MHGTNIAYLPKNVIFLGTTHMRTTNIQRSVKTAHLTILLVFGFASLVDADDVDDARTLQITESEVEAFTVMDVPAMRAYRNERLETLADALTRSNLSAEHQGLVANAMAKVYVGVPVSSYTHTTRTHSSKEDSTERTNTYQVRVSGHIQRDNLEYTSSLDDAMPFLYFSPVPFVPESGKLLDESDSTATFRFELDDLMENEGNDDMMSELAEKMKWLFEIQVNTVDQAPERLTVKLAKTVRQRFLFKLTKFQMDFDYMFIDSCGCYAVSKMSVQMKGSAIVVGRLDESVELSSTDISCEQPVQFLIPDELESSFLMF